MESMRAIELHRYGGPEVLNMEVVPRPGVKGNEVLISVRDTSVNPIDWKFRNGYMKHHLPMIPGVDVAGDITEIGAKVERFKTGDAVFAYLDATRDGAYAEYVAADQKNLALKPKSLNYIQAAALPLTVLVAWQAMFEVAALASGQSILIHGAAGGIGHLAVQLAKWKGARVIGTAAGKDTSFVKNLGADQVIDYQKQHFEDKVKEVDVVLDVIGGEIQKRSLTILKKGGILVSTVGIESLEDAVKYGVRAHAFFAHPDGTQLGHIADLIDAGVLKPVVSTVLPFAEAAKAQEMSQTGHVRGKIVLKVRE